MNFDSLRLFRPDGSRMVEKARKMRNRSYVVFCRVVGGCALDTNRPGIARAIRKSRKPEDSLKTCMHCAISVTIGFLFCALVIGCSVSSSGTTPSTLASIAITPASSSVASGATDQFTAVGKDGAGNTISGLTFTWASSATSVATISSSGVATGVLAGTTSITASSGGITSSAVTLTTTPGALASIAITPASSSVASGATDQFTATGKDGAGNALSGLTYTWESSATNVATIGSSGLATAVAAGATSITASSGGVTSSQDTLTVTPVPTYAAGTAAIGAAIAGATVTLTDSLGATSTATTASDGSYSLDTTGLTPPFLVQVATPGGNLYSVSADASNSTTINVHPYTDLMVRSWYGAQGVSADTAFSSASTYPAPTPASVNVLSSAVTGVAQMWLTNAGLDTSTFNLISSSFTAGSGSGLDQVLDQSSVNTSAGQATITSGSVTQTSAISFDTSANSMTVLTSTTNSSTSVTSTSSATSVVPAQTAQQTAINGINATMAGFVSAVNSNGSALTASQLETWMAANLVNDGLDEDQFADMWATYFRGDTIAAQLIGVKSLDLANGVADVLFDVPLAAGTHNPMELWFENVNGSWLIAGDNRIAELYLSAEARHDEGAQTGSEVMMDVAVQAPTGTVSGVSITDASGITGWNNTAFSPSGTSDETFTPSPNTTSTVTLDNFSLDNQDVSTLIPAGTRFTYTVTPTSGPADTYKVRSNAFTQELISITTPTSSTFAHYAGQLGASQKVAWTLPGTFPIASVMLVAQGYTGNEGSASTQECSTYTSPMLLPATATTATITLPTATCDGMSVTQLVLRVTVNGINGEDTEAYLYIQ